MRVQPLSPPPICLVNSVARVPACLVGSRGFESRTGRHVSTNKRRGRAARAVRGRLAKSKPVRKRRTGSSPVLSSKHVAIAQQVEHRSEEPGAGVRCPLATPIHGDLSRVWTSGSGLENRGLSNGCVGSSPTVSTNSCLLSSAGFQSAGLRSRRPHVRVVQEAPFHGCVAERLIAPGCKPDPL